MGLVWLCSFNVFFFFLKTFIPSITSTDLILSVFSHSRSMQNYYPGVLICISLMSNIVEHLMSFDHLVSVEDLYPLSLSFFSYAVMFSLALIK